MILSQPNMAQLYPKNRSIFGLNAILCQWSHAIFKTWRNVVNKIQSYQPIRIENANFLNADVKGLH